MSNEYNALVALFQIGFRSVNQIIDIDGYPIAQRMKSSCHIVEKVCVCVCVRALFVLVRSA